MKIDIGVEVGISETEGFRVAVLGQSGSGKSYLAAVIVEEALRQGIPIVVIDVEGEWYTLKQKFPVLVVGRDVPLDLESAELYSEYPLKGVSIVIDLASADASDLEARDFFMKFTEKLFQLETEHRRTLLLVVEEAEVFAPQMATKGERSSLVVANKIAKRGRKRGIHSVWITQRPASLSKDILSQCNVYLVGKMTLQRDLKAVEPYIGSIVKSLPTLSPGEFFLVHEGKVARFRTKERETPHGADTPFQLFSNPPELEGILEEIKERILKMRKDREEERSEVEKLKEEMKKLEAQLEEREKEIERLKTAQEAVQVIASALTSSSRDENGEVEQLQEMVERLKEEIKRLREERARRQIESLPDKHSLLFKSLSKDEAIVYTFVRANQPISKKDAEMLLKGELGYSRFHKAWARLVKLGLLKMRKHGRWEAKEV